MDWGGPIESFLVHIAASIQQQFDHLVVVAALGFNREMVAGWHNTTLWYDYTAYNWTAVCSAIVPPTPYRG